jgi:hypothetical protein
VLSVTKCRSNFSWIVLSIRRIWRYIFIDLMRPITIAASCTYVFVLFWRALFRRDTVKGQIICLLLWKRIVKYVEESWFFQFKKLWQNLSRGNEANHAKSRLQSSVFGPRCEPENYQTDAYSFEQLTSEDAAAPPFTCVGPETKQKRKRNEFHVLCQEHIFVFLIHHLLKSIFRIRSVKYTSIE